MPEAKEAQGNASMSAGLVALVTACYLGVAIQQAWLGNTGMAIAFGGYAFSNLGLMMALS